MITLIHGATSGSEVRSVSYLEVQLVGLLLFLIKSLYPFCFLLYDKKRMSERVCCALKWFTRRSTSWYLSLIARKLVQIIILSIIIILQQCYANLFIRSVIKEGLRIFKIIFHLQFSLIEMTVLHVVAVEIGWYTIILSYLCVLFQY